MRGDKQLINIRYNSGNVSRIPRPKASEIVSQGKANYISQTLYKAAKAGVTVTEGQSETEIKTAIRDRSEAAGKAKAKKAAEKAEAARQEADTKQKRKRKSDA